MYHSADQADRDMSIYTEDHYILINIKIENNMHEAIDTCQPDHA
ncbi:hypothetical protein KP77_10510 [Jeotgalibacillus alimentarius]|uniref:Uncharacterized protein n=1 Tax=Jeotgalibacillus alimentarius TaxID=135826 RepID=A0A0C2SC75_9BACL|nr:hypothetical protein KP77_10510 [Jeotgalibacillus alimentarius]